MAQHWLQDKRPFTATTRENIPSIVFDDSASLSSEDESLSSKATSTKKRNRPRTLYSICYPPPKNGTRQKNQRPLLQLHKVTQSSRPRPTFEIVPAARLSSSKCNEFTKGFASKTTLTGEDLAIVKAGEYVENEIAAGVDQETSSHVLSVICKTRKNDKTFSTSGKLLLHDGSEWTASTFGNGGYEFVSTDHGVTQKIRWFSKRPQGRRTDSAADSLKSLDMESIKAPSEGSLLPTFDEAQAAHAQKTAKTFSCSSISPNTRRHPIVARLTSSTIDIPDTYNIPAPFSGSDAQDPPTAKPDSQTMTPILRALVTATAVYVSLHEGWCPDFRPTLSSSLSSSSKSGAAGNGSGTIRSRTATIAEPMGSSSSSGSSSKDSTSKIERSKSPNALMRLFGRKPKDSARKDSLKVDRAEAEDRRPRTSAN